MVRVTHSGNRRCTAALFVIILFGLLASGQAQEANDLRLLEYRNPGLEVDLAVGLWAWPLPMDYDQDGDLDLVVSCPDKPSNGTYFFENKQREGDSPTRLAAGRRIGPGASQCSGELGGGSAARVAARQGVPGLSPAGI